MLHRLEWTADSQGSRYVKQDTQKQWINWYHIASFRCAVKRINNEAVCWNIQLLWHLPFIFHFETLPMIMSATTTNKIYHNRDLVYIATLRVKVFEHTC